MDSIQVKSYVNGLFEPFVKDLEWITNVDSVTGNIEGSRKIAEWLNGKIRTLGGNHETKDNGRGSHVIARFKGNGKKKVLLVVHTDTVLGTQNGQRLFKMDENKYAYGAGVGDCKAAVVQMLYLVDAMKKLNLESYAEMTVFFDAEEETGSEDEYKFARELARNSDYAIICDTGRPGWGVCTKRKSVGRYTIEVEGISGHAGNAPHAAANAVAELGYLITRIHKLGTPLTKNPLEYDVEKMKAEAVLDHGQFIPENCINIAAASTTNDKFNVIPDNAKLMVEVRCYKMSEQKRIDEEIKRICSNPTVLGTKVNCSGGIMMGPMEKTEAAARLFETYKEIVKDEYGADVVEWVAGGLTIGNITSEFVPTIDAVGVDVEPKFEHSLKEFTDLNTFVPRTVALIHLINQVDKM